MIRLKSLLTEWTYSTSVDAMVPLISQVASQFGETVAKYAGGGANGKAWILQSGKVLKLTSDGTEVTTAVWKKAKGQCKHVVGYYDIRQIINIDSDDINYYGAVYAIIMDGITPLMDEQKRWYSRFYDQYFDYRFTDDDITNDVYEYSAEPEFLAFWNNMISQRKSVLIDMRQQGVFTGEAHAGNVGFDRKTPTQFRVYDVWRQKSMKKVYASGVPNTRTIDYDALINNKPDSTGIDTPNNPDM
jgi:hypothetical protein